MKCQIKTEKSAPSKWFVLEFIIYLISRCLSGVLEAELIITFKWRDDPNLYLTVNCAAIIFTVLVVLVLRKLLHYKKDGDDLFSAKALLIAFGIALVGASALVLWRFA